MVGGRKGDSRLAGELCIRYWLKLIFTKAEQQNMVTLMPTSKNLTPVRSKTLSPNNTLTLPSQIYRDLFCLE